MGIYTGDNVLINTSHLTLSQLMPILKSRRSSSILQYEMTSRRKRQGTKSKCQDTEPDGVDGHDRIVGETVKTTTMGPIKEMRNLDGNISIISPVC